MEDDIQLYVVLVLAVIKKGDTYLLGLRSSKDPQAGGTWGFIGGKVDHAIGDNIIEETVTREVEEECGVVISKKIQYLTSSGFVRVSGHHVVSFAFLTEYLSGEAKPLDGQDEVKWFTLEELKMLIAQDKRIQYLLPIVEKLSSL